MGFEVVKVCIMSERLLSKCALRLICGCQSGHGGWYMVVKVIFEVVMWFSLRALWLLSSF